ncbi:MAG: hypothetical protein ABIQ53_02355 [Terracoccus sp.]
MPHLPAAPIPPQAVAAQTTFDWAMLTWAFSGGLMILVLTASLAIAFLRPSSGSPSTKRRSESRGAGTTVSAPRNPASEDRTLPASAKWTFADSWATNLTALITGAAAVVAIFAKDLQGVFRDQAPLAFSLTPSVMLAVSALAPIAYGVLQGASPQLHEATKGAESGTAEPQGTMWGWCVSASLTLFAIGGSLFAALRLVADVRGPAGPSVGKAFAWLILVLVIALVVAYVLRSFLTIANALRLGSSIKLRSLVGMVDVSCCQGAAERPRTRMSLL